MNLPIFFAPPRRTGLIIQIVLALFTAGLGAYLLYRASLSNLGGVFLVYLFLALLVLAPFPLLVYRAYALWGSYYVLERDGLRFHWGLRSEDIPLPQIEWVRRAVDLPTLFQDERGRQQRLPLPWLSWPGGILGQRQVAGLGRVEYLASDEHALVLIATPSRVFAISPANPVEFIRSFYRVTELGSLSPLSAQSVYPGSLLARVWADRPARVLLLAGLGLGLVLLVWVTLVIPAQPQIIFGYSTPANPLEPVPSEQLLLLPVLQGLSYLVALAGGLNFYRKPEHQPVAYFVWGANVLEALLLIASVGFLTLR